MPARDGCDDRDGNVQGIATHTILFTGGERQNSPSQQPSPQPRRSSRRRSAEFGRSPHVHVITGLGAIVVVARRSPSAAPAPTAPLAVHAQQTHSVSLIDVTVNCSSRRVSGHGVVESTVDMVAVLERVSGRMRVH